MAAISEPDEQTHVLMNDLLISRLKSEGSQLYISPGAANVFVSLTLVRVAVNMRGGEESGSQAILDEN